MISQPMTNETIVVLSTNGMNLSQTEKPQPSNQRQDSLKKYVKDEVNVIGAIQIFCGVMVLNFGIILASASFSPHFTRVFSTLLKSGYPFTGSLCVSTVPEEGRMGWRGGEDVNSLASSTEQGVNGGTSSPICVVQGRIE
uniref:Membrane spanning 4-domains A6A n=1 Tax=Propithecus coquereli TaxID=379532 RepID=A0A2K6EPQ8_PROCO